jgi:demethylmenaquinone methyltransferase/2-methoxy-6-polyprenyl-1,4-benzoquinol methylase
MGLLEDKSRARTFYRYLSKVYDRVNPVFWNEDMRDECIELLGVSDEDHVLDVGCGTGFATRGLLEHTHHVEALDQSVHQLQKAREKDELAGVDFVRGDAENLPYADETFDAVWSSGSIEYWPTPVDALSEARRVTKPGGRVLVVGPRRPSGRVAGAIADSIMLFYDEKEATRMFREAGWTDIEHTLMGSEYVEDDAIVTVARKPE